MKKTLAVLLAVLMLFSLSVISASAVSQSSALAWAESKIGTYYDYDGVYGSQCVDLVLGYYDYFGQGPVSGNADDFSWNAVPAGFTRYSFANIPGGIQPGDIFVNTSGTYGHVGIIYSVSGTNSFVSIDANWPDYSGQAANDTGEDNRAIKYVTHNNYSLWGVIRPTFTSSPASGSNESWRTTDAVNMRSGPGTSYGTYTTVPAQTTVTVTDKIVSGSYTWGRVSYGGYIGYIALDFATKLSGTFSQSWTTTDAVNMRSGPGTGYGVIITVPAYANITVTMKYISGGYTWGYVSYNGYSGYLALDYATQN
ncbi:MAG: SH3 domain-containing protein [Oscillospiraceae bacterium]|jgi:uncharacterized protein YraI|nr:SH3 domain-containing protein [Oscillospiraceae bacterium]